MICEGESFPLITLHNQDGVAVDLRDFLGRKFLVYFYPKDDTSGCTIEACEFRDQFPNFSSIAVIGVSPDSPKSHRKFADKYSLPFTLLADEEHRLAEACGVWVEKSMYGKKYMGIQRSSFLVSENGIVEKVWDKVKPEGHADEVLALL